MSPIEVIARAIFHADYDEDESWEGCPDLHPVYIKMAVAVIDALEKMEVSDLMAAKALEYWNPPTTSARMETADAWSLWRAMVGAMRDE